MGWNRVLQGGGETLDDVGEFAKRLPPKGRLVGLDLGTRTIGLALSDVGRTVASPLETIRRTNLSAGAARLIALAEKHAVAGLVLGLPLHLDGREGRRVQATRAFAANLNKVLSLPILLWDERLSTAAAERALIDADASRRRRAEVIDKVAAAIILQGALDRLNRLG
ncbi:MAG TPA: Holliday junction resolvase RuvX [Hyphomicrobiaceae bacterium]|nr:Holliday junction resolvase RuvX [Hyphomicrobiaceae bacterium]